MIRDHDLLQSVGSDSSKRESLNQLILVEIGTLT
jgi:hypothetical protein